MYWNELNSKQIFLVPLDGETYNLNKNQNVPHPIQEEIKNDGGIINYIVNKDLEEEEQNNLKLKSKPYLYSSLKNNKNLCISDSNKIYISEFLKKNWKKRVNRIKSKLKKKYFKKANNSSEEIYINSKLKPNVIIDDKSINNIIYISNTFSNNNNISQNNNCNKSFVNIISYLPNKKEF